MTKFGLLINGRLVPGDDTLPIRNPATGAVFATSPRASRKQLDEAIEAAAAAFPGWAATDVEDRRKVLTSVADNIQADAAGLAALLTAEQGKPLSAARGEVAATVAFFRYAAGIEVSGRPVADPKRSVEILRRPLGPVAAIVPWNFPLLEVGFKIPFALLTGNTVVLKPAPTTPLTTLRFAELVADLLPAGVLNVIVDDDDLGDALTSHPGIRKVTFTGSTATGRQVMASAAPTLKRLTLELGGNDAALVLDDAEPAEIASALFTAAFKNSGQVCLAIKRLYVHDSMYDEVCDRLADLADAAVVGDGAGEGVEYGPVQNERQFLRLLALLADARTHGTVVAGGQVHDGPGYFMRPTVVRDIAEGARLVDEEQFGPILPVIRYTDLDDAVQRCNDSGYGLGASVWSGDAARARLVARRLEAGTVWINKHADIAPHIPNSGAKQSGFGAELGEEGLAEFTQIQVLSEDRI